MASRPLLGESPAAGAGLELMPAQVSLLRTKSGERLSRERGLGSRVRAKSGEWPWTQSGIEPSWLSEQFARLELSISTFSQRVKEEQEPQACRRR